LKTCVIFNPTAKGGKARHFRHRLARIGTECAFKPTFAVGDAQRLAAEAVREGFQFIVAAGGDGTVNEVLNGLAPDGFDRACLGVLPLGTVNVFARELAIPFSLNAAWKVIREGRETRIDLPCVEFEAKGGRRRRYFAQLAGAGLDARAIELVQWDLKKRIGPLAYVLAGFTALRNPPTAITATGDGHSETGELALLGNGRLYGGTFRIFPKANSRDGRLEVCLFPRARLLTVLRCAPSLLLRGRLPAGVYRHFQASSLTLTSPNPTPLEVDGELIGHLPATFSVRPRGLRVVVPWLTSKRHHGIFTL
jgi:YegS/Rv2252/BmrU family lipid kinase